ncbi:GNAT family N-acetyltransferase [Ginsengibacter hankyongi]|uniref:GNAT family N-acetyltransferase n=2 Tax=Ginsengibacter hankyongi TaxID=2607284 RepID=A0A5J5IP45_9BACT|nr:GNAT family N-acetyltransferase [Ginsengibacter hankyongi]
MREINTSIPATITTERLSLDLLTTQDGPFMRELMNTQGWLTFIGDRNIHSDEDAIVYINKINSNPDFTYWTVRLKQLDKPIGVITFLKRTYLKHFDIGFAFLPEYCGQGYASEAAGEVLSIVQRLPAHATVLATTIPTNASSIKLLTRLGFRFEKEIEEGGNKLHVYANVV